MILKFDLNSIDDYRLFVKVKQLPVFRFRGRTAWFPDEYASRVGVTAGVKAMLGNGNIGSDDFHEVEWVYIYGLEDPRTWSIRYIGKSVRPKERLSNHCNDRSKTYKTNWINELKRIGLTPHLVILDRCNPEDDWQDLERRWILRGRTEGWPLTNQTDGGDGVPGLPPETRERIVAASKGRSPSAETRSKIGAKSKGRKHTQEWREYMSQRMADRVFTEDHRNKISDATRLFSDAQCEEIRQRIANGEKVYKIAEELGVHRMTISRIKMGLYPKGWKR